MQAQKTSMVIADDNREFCYILNDFLRSENDFEIMGVAHDGASALEMITKQKPDVVILDIIMPQLDGLAVLEELYSNQDGYRPKVIMLSALGQDDITQRAVAMGANYFIVKPFDLTVLAARIRQMKQSNSTTTVLQAGKEPRTRSIDQSKKPDSLEATISNTLHDLGVPANIKGYYYVRDAIKLTVLDPVYINNMIKKLYPEVAKMNDSTPSKVERAIRHAIFVSFKRGNEDTILMYFGNIINNKKRQPTNSEFIAILADKIRLDEEKKKTIED